MAEVLRIEVAAGLPQRQVLVELQVTPGTTVGEAVGLAGLHHRLPGLDIDTGRLGIFGRPCSPDRKLADGDRVEVYQPLKADPKEVRRQLADLKKKDQGGGS